MGYFSGKLRGAASAVVGTAMLVVATSSSAPALPASQGLASAPHVIFRIDVSRIRESSSLVASGAHPGLVYTANDSGDGPYIYVLNHSGDLVGTTTLAGVHAVDIEAMSKGRDGTLVVADIGDNDKDRGSVQIYRIPQPTAGDHTVTPEKVTLTYSDGPRDAESVLYDAANGRVFVVSKEILGHVYTTPADVFSHSSAKLTQVASGPTIATDATFMPAHKRVIIRTYTRAYIYDYPSWKSESDFPLPKQKQGESITSVPGETYVWVGSEGVDSPVWMVPVKARKAALVHSARPTSGPPRSGGPTAERAGATDGGRSNDRSMEVLGAGAGALLVLGAALTFWYRSGAGRQRVRNSRSG